MWVLLRFPVTIWGPHAMPQIKQTPLQRTAHPYETLTDILRVRGDDEVAMIPASSLRPSTLTEIILVAGELKGEPATY